MRILAFPFRKAAEKASTKEPLLKILLVAACLLCSSELFAQNKIFIGDFLDAKVQRADLDGTNYEDIATGTRPFGIAVDSKNSKIYWQDLLSGILHRADLDGGNPESLLTTAGGNSGIIVDAVGGKIFYGDSNGIHRANLDGSGSETISSETDSHSLSLDLMNGKIYWTDNSNARISRSNLDGTEAEAIISSGLMAPVGLGVDSAAGKIYWADVGSGKVQRANVDGSNIEDIVTGLPSVEGFALDSAGGKVYWGDSTLDKVSRANIDGSDVEDVIPNAGDRPLALALLIDSDGDGTYDDLDGCPLNANKIEPSLNTETQSSLEAQIAKFTKRIRRVKRKSSLKRKKKKKKIRRLKAKRQAKQDELDNLQPEC